VFMTVLLSAWTGMHLCVFWRLSTIPFIHSHISRPYLFAVAAVLWASLFLGRFLDSRGLETPATLLERFYMNWLGILFLIFCCVLAIDVVTAFGFVIRSHVPMLRAVGLVAGIVLAAVALIQGARSPVVNDCEIRLANLPPEDDGLQIAVISDLHVGRLLDGQWLAARIEQIKALHPDLVLMLGDLFEGDSQAECQDSMKSLFRTISARYGVWAVTGNHESHGGRDGTVQFLEAAGVHVLRNEWRQLTPGLALGGVDDGGHYDSLANAQIRITKTLAAKPTGVATIFLSHRPQMVNEVASAGVGLMLCGHTHAGQIWPFSYLVRLFNPYLVGEYMVNGMPLIVSRGAGTWGPRMRLWLPGELLRITLRIG
jgi:predicted MPP superfamily phosphohydrolase